MRSNEMLLALGFITLFLVIGGLSYSTGFNDGAETSFDRGYFTGFAAGEKVGIQSNATREMIDAYLEYDSSYSVVYFNGDAYSLQVTDDELYVYIYEPIEPNDNKTNITVITRMGVAKLEN